MSVDGRAAEVVNWLATSLVKSDGFVKTVLEKAAVFDRWRRGKKVTGNCLDIYRYMAFKRW